MEVHNLVIFITSLSSLIQGLLSEEILGCGGFIKSHASIDYSKVHIKLYTKTGSLKDETECAPNNGYYFLPLYDKGEYILKISPPRGWSFEPTEVSLDVDGSTDICSQGKDINFTFKGFGIAGRVISANTPAQNPQGPPGITVTLYTEKIGNENVIGTTTTSSGGVFSFTPIQPGKYVLLASHPVWKMEKNTIEVTVKEGNTELPDNSLIVFGYDINGRVISEDDQPVSGVSFILFGDGKFKDCSTVPQSLELDDDPSWGKPLCQVKSDSSGKFKFPAVTNGNYRLVPHYAGVATKFHVQPPELSFTVSHSSMNLAESFRVTGFTVSGIILLSKTEKTPLANAKVFIGGKQVAVADQNGHYSIDKMKSGHYTLKIQANDVKFDDINVKISASTPELPVASPSSYKVCGNVKLSSKGTIHHRKVIIENSDATFHREIDTDPKTGDYCHYLSPGKYQFSVVVNNDEKTKGLQFFPLQQTIDVVGRPVSSVNFLQLKAVLSGSIKCLSEASECESASVTLKVLDGSTVKTIQAIGGKYEFTEVLPGHYEVLIDTDVFCWENPVQQVSVTSEKAIVPVFKQTGFTVTFISSHDSAVEFYDPGKSKKIALTLPMGSTRHCVTTPGIYKFTPKSCHVYGKDYTWDTSNRNPIILTSNEHRHRGKIVVSSPTDVDDVKVKIESGDKTIFAAVKLVRGKENHYVFEFNANVDSTYVITPQSDIILFSPPSMKITGTNDCNNEAAVFSGQIGRIISGRLSPPLEGVTVKIFGKDKEAPVHTLVTQTDGAYRIGPLDGSIEYTVTAEKVGFSISQEPDNGVFHAEKLAEIVVDVVDSADDNALQGVLLSLSGGQGGYRKNSVTGQLGQLVFNSLSPGEYYLRAMMKEYRFDPPSKIIKVTEGATVRIKLLAKRVAFSAWGIITSLNGEPEPGLIVEAKGNGGVAKNSPTISCQSLQEEATSEENGRFRIRGLEPGCIYSIKLKNNEFQTNSQVYRASPEALVIDVVDKDVEGLRFIAFHPIPRTDVSVHIVAEQPEHYKTLRVKLCREDQPDSPIHTVKIDPQQSNKFNQQNNPGFLLHFPSLQSNGKKYFVQLDSSLSSSLYRYKIIPSYFEANTSFKALTLGFNAERKVDQGEMNQSSVIALPLITIVAIAFLNREKLWNWLSFTVEQWSKPGPVQRSPVVQSIPIDPRADDIIVEQIMNINKRKTKPRKA